MWIEKKENPPLMLMRWVRQSFGSLHVVKTKSILSLQLMIFVHPD